MRTTLFSVLLMAAEWHAVGTYGEGLLRGQTPGANPRFQPDPYVELRAAGADNVPRITTKFQIDLWWPKPLPNDWALGPVVGVCANSKDHVFVVERTEEGPGEAGPWQGNKYASPVLEFGPEGDFTGTWGEANTVPSGISGCYVDREDDVWINGNNDAIVQKYTREGKLLLQIGTKGKFDTSDGTMKGKALNAGHALLNRPLALSVDSASGDVYIADGGGNRRVAVFDRRGAFIRQFGRQATKEEAESGAGGAFTGVVNSLALSNDGLLYVGDRDGKRIQVFDKMGNFKMNISVPRRRKDLMGQEYHRPGLTIAPAIYDKAEIYGIVLSRDKPQRYLYVGTPEGLIWTVERKNGRPISAFGQKGYGAGEMRISNMTIDTKGNLVVGSTNRGLQRFKAIGKD